MKEGAITHRVAETHGDHPRQGQSHAAPTAEQDVEDIKEVKINQKEASHPTPIPFPLSHPKNSLGKCPALGTIRLETSSGQEGALPAPYLSL